MKPFALGEPSREEMMCCSSMPLSQPNYNPIWGMFVQEIACIWHFDGCLVTGAGSQPDTSGAG